MSKELPAIMLIPKYLILVHIKVLPEMGFDVFLAAAGEKALKTTPVLLSNSADISYRLKTVTGL